MTDVTDASPAVSQQSELGKIPQHKLNAQQKQQSFVGGLMGSLRVIELQLVAFIMVFSATGLVSLLDLAFPAFASLYFIALSRFAFPSHGSQASSEQEIIQGSMLFQFYVIAGTILGLFLPLAYVLGGFARGDDHAVRSATPHLFLLSFQILTENVISRLSLFSPPVRALVPMLYTVRRLFVISDWMQDVWFDEKLPADVGFQLVAWHGFGKVLSVANLVFFSTNLFCFLIPRFLPMAFEKYFDQKNETHAKMGEDKHLSAKKSNEQKDKKSN